MEISGYTATEDSFPEEVYRELNADKHVYRHYRSPGGDQVDLYIGYYGTAKGGRTGHNPYACLPGAGSAIIETGRSYLRQPGSSSPVAVNFVLARKNDSNTIMLHWYQTRGNTVVSTGLKKNLQRFVGRVLYNRNDGAFVQITASAADADVRNARKRVEQFAGAVLDQLPAYWPVER
jgi:EpsI family protein